MIYILDTDICIACLRNKPEAINQRLQQTPRSSLGISLITVLELLYGVEKGNSSQSIRLKLKVFISQLNVRLLDLGTAQEYADIRAYLERLGQPIGPLDLMIAAQARQLGATLVTGNTREFKRVPNLQVENWFTPPENP